MLARETPPAEVNQEARVARIENGLLPGVQLRGTETMALRDRLEHYRAGALSLAVIDDFQVAWARAWGTVALDRDDEATVESLFQAGSASKPVAALVTSALVRKGALTLDQPVATLFEKRPALRAALGERVLVRHLLAHTAALPTHSWRGWYRDDGPPPSTADMLAEAELAPAGPPGGQILYSNPGYLLLQLSIEEAAGLPFQQVAAAELFSPLDLKRSSFEEPLPRALWESAVWGHYQGEPIRGKGRMYPAAPAGLWTTPSDLARLMAEVMLAAAGRSHAIVPAEVAREMLAPTLPDADRTLAWSVAGEGDATRIFHEGRVAGFTALVVGFPERGQGLAVMASSHGAHPLLLEVARAVAAEYGWPGFLEEREAVRLSEEDLRRFEGRYEYEASPGLVISFQVRDGKLFARTGENPEWETIPIGDRELAAPDGAALLRFQVDEKGRFTGFRIGVPGGGSAQVNRVDQADELPSKLAEFDAFAREHRLENTVLSMSYAIVKDGRIVAIEGIGWQDHDAEERTTPDTSYLVASITKTFSAATLLAMDADGIIDLDADFTTLSDWQERCDWLTNSGIIFRGGVTLDDGYTPPEIDCSAKITLRDVLTMRVLGEPGSNFLYNPIVYGRLSNWVEEQTDKPFTYWVRRYVIDKAGLENTAAGWRDAEAGDARRLLAPPFRHAPEQSDNLAPSVLPNPEMNASSGIIASARELALYSIALDEGRILSPELRETMWMPPTDSDGEPASYAYGWWVQPWRGQKLVWHGGWWPDAYAGFLLKVPGKGLTLVALGNTDGLHWGNRLHVAEIEKSPLASKFLELFAAD